MANQVWKMVCQLISYDFGNDLVLSIAKTNGSEVLLIYSILTLRA